ATGAAYPSPAYPPNLRRLDCGPEAERGIGCYPPLEGEPYPCPVAALDAGGNEVAGIRLPDISVPVASHAGWNLRHPETGGAGQIVGLVGATVPFAATATERQRRSDPRPSIAERYRDRDDYCARVRRAAEALT